MNKYIIASNVMNKKNVFLIFLCSFILLLSLSTISKGTEKMDLSVFKKEHIELGLPLIIIKGTKGFLACGYINVETCNKTNEACAIVSGVKTHDDMVVAEVKAVSNKAKELGVKLGMTGEEVLKLFR